MIIKVKSMLIVVTLLCLSIFDTNFSIIQYHNDSDKTEKNIQCNAEETDKKYEEKNILSDDCKTDIFTYYQLSSTITHYIYLQKKHIFKILTILFRPPIFS